MVSVFPIAFGFGLFLSLVFSFPRAFILSFVFSFTVVVLPALGLGPSLVGAAAGTHAGFPGILVVCSLLGLFTFSGAFRLRGPFAVILITLIKKSLGRQGGHAASALEGQHGVRLKHRS